MTATMIHDLMMLPKFSLNVGYDGILGDSDDSDNEDIIQTGPKPQLLSLPRLPLALVRVSQSKLLPWQVARHSKGLLAFLGLPKNGGNEHTNFVQINKNEHKPQDATTSSRVSSCQTVSTTVKSSSPASDSNTAASWRSSRNTTKSPSTGDLKTIPSSCKVHSSSNQSTFGKIVKLRKRYKSKEIKAGVLVIGKEGGEQKGKEVYFVIKDCYPKPRVHDEVLIEYNVVRSGKYAGQLNAVKVTKRMDNNLKNHTRDPVSPVILHKAAHAWKPGVSPVTDVVRVKQEATKVFNKLTWEKFDKLFSSVLDVPIRTVEEYNVFVDTLIERAATQIYLCDVFAAFAAKLTRFTSTLTQDLVQVKLTDEGWFWWLTTTADKPKLEGPVDSKLTEDLVRQHALSQHCTRLPFNFALLKRCRADFEESSAFLEAENVFKSAEAENKAAKKSKSLTSEQQMSFYLEKKKFEATKKRKIGMVHFVGELYLVGMLNSAAMIGCLKHVMGLATASAVYVELMCILFSVVGEKLQKSCEPSEFEALWTEMLLLSKSKSIPSKIRFMSMDLVDLRKREWVPSSVKARKSKKLADVARELTADTLAAEADMRRLHASQGSENRRRKRRF